jgi:hypothetical protein
VRACVSVRAFDACTCVCVRARVCECVCVCDVQPTNLPLALLSGSAMRADSRGFARARLLQRGALCCNAVLHARTCASCAIAMRCRVAVRMRTSAHNSRASAHKRACMHRLTHTGAGRMHRLAHTGAGRTDDAPIGQRDLHQAARLYAMAYFKSKSAHQHTFALFPLPQLAPSALSAFGRSGTVEKSSCCVIQKSDTAHPTLPRHESMAPPLRLRWIRSNRRRPNRWFVSGPR